MSKRIATISYEKEITDIEYDNLFNSLKSYETLKVKFPIQILSVKSVKLL